MKKEESVSHQEIKSDYYEMELIPKNETQENKTGVIFRGESEEYAEAQKKLRISLRNKQFR